MKLIPYTVFAVLLVTAFATNALANELAAVNESKISLTAAISAAETHQGGRAFEAELDTDSFSPTYEVGIIKDSKLYDVRVDAVSGKVTGAREDVDD